MHASPLSSTIVLLCALAGFTFTSALPYVGVGAEQTFELYKLPSYKDFKDFTAPAERENCAWMDMDYGEDKVWKHRGKDNEGDYTRSWDGQDAVRYVQKLMINYTHAESSAGFRQGNLMLLSITTCKFTAKPEADCQLGVSTVKDMDEDTFKPTWLEKEDVTLEKVTITFTN